MDYNSIYLATVGVTIRKVILWEPVVQLRRVTLSPAGTNLCYKSYVWTELFLQFGTRFGWTSVDGIGTSNFFFPGSPSILAHGHWIWG
jgi:hypothetical protein